MVLITEAIGPVIIDKYATIMVNEYVLMPSSPMDSLSPEFIADIHRSYLRNWVTGTLRARDMLNAPNASIR